MQNDFEKQVQQKMEELNCVPSEPVWTNIEKEIRKKNKRRFFIWLPLLVLLVGGGLYWNYSEKRSVSNNNDNQNIGKVNLSTTNTNTQSIKNKETEKEENRINNIPSALKNSHNKIKINSSAIRPLYKNNKYQKEKPSYGKLNSTQNVEVITRSNSVMQKNEDYHSSNQLLLKEGGKEKARFIDHVFTVHEFNVLFDAKEKWIAANTITNEKKIVLNHKHNWVIGLETSIGISNHTSKGESMDKSYAASFPGTFPQSTMIQSPYTQSLSYSAGITLSRKLNKSIEFKTGITYQYLSFDVLVGQYVKQDTVVNMYALNQYYRNTSYSVNQSWTLSNYKNQLHLISIPLKLGYEPFTKVPIKLSAGIILQQLIHSNMLIYDVNSGVYYNSNRSLNKFIVASTAGIDYSFPFLKHTFSIGPYFNYGLSNTIKDKAGYLYNINFKASVDLKKLNAKQRF